MIGRVLSRTVNPVAVTGHLATGDVGRNGPTRGGCRPTGRSWRATCSPRPGSPTHGVARVTGKADRSPDADDPPIRATAAVEITLLRHFEP